MLDIASSKHIVVQAVIAGGIIPCSMDNTSAVCAEQEPDAPELARDMHELPDSFTQRSVACGVVARYSA